MMDGPNERNPAGGPGFERAQPNGRGLHIEFTAMHAASARALEHELAIVLAAANRLAAGYGLAWPDLDRLHEAHQHILRVLASLRRVEVLQ